MLLQGSDFLIQMYSYPRITLNWIELWKYFLFWPICNLFQIVEFVAVLLKTGNEVAEKEMASSGTIRRVIDLFFE